MTISSMLLDIFLLQGKLMNHIVIYVFGHGIVEKYINLYIITYNILTIVNMIHFVRNLIYYFYFFIVDLGFYGNKKSVTKIGLEKIRKRST